MKKLLFLLLTSGLIFSCNQAPKEKQSEQSSEPTVIGYEFNDDGEKLNIIVGDAAMTDVYLEYIQAHNDRDLSKISEMSFFN